MNPCTLLRQTLTSRNWLKTLAAPVLMLAAGTVSAQSFEPPSEPPEEWGPISSTMEEVSYPYPVEYMDVTLFGQDGRMAYMDVEPTGPANGRTVLIFHGMNFYGKAYEPMIEALTAAGFRAIAIDRIGYGRSSKLDIPYNLNMVSSNIKALMDHLEIDEAAAVGHSMGGMVASRFAMQYPDAVTHVAMVNQIGMTDQRQGRGWTDIEDAYERVLNGTTYESILRGHLVYFEQGFQEEYFDYVRWQYGQTLTAEWPRLARIRAWQQSILYNDPVVYDWQHIDTKALVIGGRDDRLGGGRYQEQATMVSETLPNAALILYPGVGHSPHFEHPDVFHGDLIDFLSSDPGQSADEWMSGR
ncbi:MAG: alpha/beta fold hydrolase [Pseudomonadota bacterium]